MAYKAFVDKNRGFGVEIECCADSPTQTLDFLYDLQDRNYEVEISREPTPDIHKWTIARDSTISANEPVELISPVLKLTNSEDLFNLELAVHRLKENKFFVNESCGFHVHWDVSDFSGSQVLTLLKFYAKFERTIDLLVDKSRRKDWNSECRSLLRNGDYSWIDRLRPSLQFPTAIEVSDRFTKLYSQSKDSTPKGARRYKVNITSINKYKTVEFRHYQGTLDFNEMFLWILFTGQLINRAKSLDVRPGEENLGNLIRALGLADHQMSWSTKYISWFIRLREIYKLTYKLNSKGEK